MKHLLPRGAVFILFALFFIYGIKAYNDYGISWDEPIERESSLVTWKYLHPEDSTLVTDTVNFNMVTDLDDYQYRYYGTAAQYPLTLAESLTGFTMSFRHIYLMRHLYVFLLFFCAAVCFYRLCRRLTGDGWLALTGVLFLILSPRILADSFYNIKDSLTLSLYLIAAWSGVCFLEKTDVKNILLFSFFAALCTNARIVGAVIPVCCLAVFLCQGIFCPGEKQTTVSSGTQKEKQGKNGGKTQKYTWKKRLSVSVVTGILTLGCYIFMSPVLWQNPVGEMINTVKTFSSYGGYEGTVLFLNHSYRPDQLPWFYLPLWICITTPLTILALALIGAATQTKQLFQLAFHRRNPDYLRRNFTDSRASRLFLFLTAAVPVLYALILKPSLYNGWRHFYFIYPFIALSAVAGLRFLCRQADGLSIALPHRTRTISGRTIPLLITFLCLCVTGVWILSRHPYEYAYFNVLARGSIEDNFEKDYWAVSQRDQLIYLCQTESREQFSVWMNEGTRSCRYLLDEASQNRILVTDNAARADYLVDRHVENPDTSYFKLEHMYRPVHSITVDGVALSTVYERVYDQSCQSFLTQEQDRGTYTIGHIDWNRRAAGKDRESDAGFAVWTGRLSQPLHTDLLMVYAGEDGSISQQDIRVEVSGDGNQWIPAETISGWDFRFPKTEIGFIRISCPEQDGSLEVCVYRQMTDGPSDIPYIVEGVSSDFNPEQAVLAVDGTKLTCWSSQEPQRPGMEYRLFLRRTCPLSCITLSLGDSPWDRPEELEIWNSLNGTDWTRLDASTEDGEHYRFEQTDCRFLKFILGPGCEGSQSNWSIYEIELYGEADEK